MKHTLLTALLSVFVMIAFGQSFEGTVTYEMEIKNPMPDKIPDSLFFASIGGASKFTQVYNYKDNLYKSEIKETGLVQSYDPKANRLYSYNAAKDSAAWSDGSKYMDELVEIRKLDEKETILGVECNVIVIKSTLAETTYYYSDRYKMDPKLFKGHKYGLWEDYLKETGALPLKFVVKSPFSNMVTTAVDIKEEALSNDLFKLPKFKSVVKNPF